jgi:hypothetical protein
MPTEAYNPYILGFVQQGATLNHVWLPLREALERYGGLPSRYGLLPAQAMRNERPVLNLKLGIAIERILQQTPDLKRHISAFYNSWHRDWQSEFGVDVRPLFNRNDPQRVAAWIDRHRRLLEEYEAFSVRQALASSDLIRRDVLNSISDEVLAEKAIAMLERKVRRSSLPATGKLERIIQLSNDIRLHTLLQRFDRRSGQQMSRMGSDLAQVYADEAAEVIVRLCAITGDRCSGVQSPSGQGIEFAYARRGREILTLGSLIGDCTAKPYRQIDTHTENIYWTLFPWLLDQNYLILKVIYEGDLVAKAHLLPLATYERGGFHLFLAVDAIETDVTMRQDVGGGHKISPERCLEILQLLSQEVQRIAAAMGIDDIYAELFSNNPLVRQWLEGMERIYLDVNSLHKVDELEDVYSMACTLAREYEQEQPDHVFMEIQFRNIQLMSHHTPRRNIKGFARLQQGRLSGYAMGQVIGV